MLQLHLRTHTQEKPFKLVLADQGNNDTCTVDSRYLEIEGTLKNSSRYPYFDISDL